MATPVGHDIGALRRQQRHGRRARRIEVRQDPAAARPCLPAAPGTPRYSPTPAAHSCASPRTESVRSSRWDRCCADRRLSPASLTLLGPAL